MSRRTIVRPRRALLAVDATNGFISARLGGELPVEGGEEIGPVIGELQASGIYVVRGKCFDEHDRKMFNLASNNPGRIPYVDRSRDRNGGWTTIYPDHNIKDTWGVKCIDGIDPKGWDAFFPKGTDVDLDSYSALGNPQLVPWLIANGIGHVDVCGLVHRICAGMTAVELALRHFKVRIVTDATRDLVIPGFEWVLNEFEYRKIEMVTKEQVLSECKPSRRRTKR